MLVKPPQGQIWIGLPQWEPRGAQKAAQVRPQNPKKCRKKFYENNFNHKSKGGSW